MSSVASALDSYGNRNTGENECPQHAWEYSTNDEAVVQLFFQIVLIGNKVKSKYAEHEIKTKYQSILITALYEKRLDIVAICYKLISQTRDIINGKGLYQMSYVLLGVWVDICYNRQIAHHRNVEQALRLFVQKSGEHPYGSWKDLKYFANYCIDNNICTKDSLIINTIADLYSQQIYQDYIKPQSDSLSLVSRWAPREKSKKFGWLVPIISNKLYDLTYGENDQLGVVGWTTPVSIIRRFYRQTITKINKLLDTTQIKQCDQDWSSIDFNKVTSITMKRQVNAFLNRNNSNSEKEPDRIQCADNIRTYIETAKKLSETTKGKKVIVKGKRIAINELVQDAVCLSQSNNTDPDLQSKMDLLNLQWEDNGKQNMNCGTIIPLVDVSGSMCCDNRLPINSAIGLGIRISEKSIIRNRVLTFSSDPTWVSLDEEQTFISKVEKLSRAEWGGSTDIQKAYRRILEAIENQKLHPNDVGQLILVVLSDMQFNDNQTNMGQSNETMFETMKREFEESGIKTYGVPYKLPTLLFWNLRTTKGFPVLSKTDNTIMLSGNSPVLLNEICNKGIDFLEDINPVKMFKEIMSNERYEDMVYLDIEL